MSDLRRRVSHLVGIAERYDLRDSGREGRVLAEAIDVLREIALEVDEVSNSQLEIEEYLEEVDTDLMSLEENLYLGMDDDGDDDDDAWESVSEEDNSYIELECPVCELDSSYNEGLFNQDGIRLSCPHCGNVVFDADEDMLVFDDDDNGYR